MHRLSRAMALIAALTLAIVIALTSVAAATSPPRLSYVKAKRAFQSKADAFAKAPTKVTAMFRLSDPVWTARAEWKRENPTGCTGCGYDPVTGSFFDTPITESCSVSLRAKQFRSGRVQVSTEDFACY